MPFKPSPFVLSVSFIFWIMGFLMENASAEAVSYRIQVSCGCGIVRSSRVVENQFGSR